LPEDFPRCRINGWPMDRRLFFTLMNFFFLLGFLYLVYYILAPFLGTLGWAGVIGISTYPLYRRLRKRLPGRGTIAASIMTPLVVLTLVVPFVLFIFVLGLEVTQVYQYLETLTAAGGSDILGTLSHNPAIQPILDRIQPLLTMLDIEIGTTLLPALKSVAAFLLGYSTVRKKAGQSEGFLGGKNSRDRNCFPGTIRSTMCTKLSLKKPSPCGKNGLIK